MKAECVGCYIEDCENCEFFTPTDEDAIEVKLPSDISDVVRHQVGRAIMQRVLNNEDALNEAADAIIQNVMNGWQMKEKIGSLIRDQAELRAKTLLEQPEYQIKIADAVRDGVLGAIEIVARKVKGGVVTEMISKVRAMVRNGLETA